MSLSDVKLNQGMIAGLYRNHLVHAASDAEKKPEDTGLNKDSIPPIPDIIPSLQKNEIQEAKADLINDTYIPKIKYLGKNEQRIVILVKNPEEVFLADNELKLLTKMLTACKLTLADVAILNIAQSPVQQEQIHSELYPSKVIMLGVDSKDILLPVNFPEYRVQPHGPCNYLMAPGLSTMNSDTEASRNIKTQLWMALKQLFSL